MGTRSSRPVSNATKAASSAAAAAPAATTANAQAMAKTSAKASAGTVLLNNLNKIGQVHVTKSHETTHVIRTRTRQPKLDSDPPNLKNKIDAFGLFQLLDGRKAASPEPIGFDLDPALVRRLAARYNSPSIRRQYTRTLPNGEQRTYREAVWVDA